MVSIKQEPKAEEAGMRDYELVVIFNPELEEEKLEAAVDDVSQFITQGGGAVAEVDRWGKKKLAYPIKHFMEGHYVLTKFKMKPELSKELEARLNISEEVLRHLLIRQGD